MSKKFCIFTFVIAVSALLFAGIAYYDNKLLCENFASLQQNHDDHDVQFVLYLGTNSKDSNNPVFTHDEAKAKLDEILSKHFEGFTVLEALGGWTDEEGKISHEYTLVIYLSDTDIRKVYAASDELLKVFNQNSVLIHVNETKTEFYSGRMNSE